MPAFFDFDDLLPEEQDAQLGELLSLFASPEQEVEAMPPEEEQSQILSRVRQRLQQIEMATTQPVSAGDEPTDDGIPVRLPVEESDLHRPLNEEERIENRPQGKENSRTFIFPVAPSRQRTRLPRASNLQLLIGSIAAVLLVGVLLGLLVLVGGHGVENSAATAGIPYVPVPQEGHSVGPVGNTINVQSSANGLDASFQITAGPYFLSELLEVKMTLTNHGQKPVQIMEGACGAGPLSIEQSGGGNSTYQLPLLPLVRNCNNAGPEKFASGQTITTHDYIIVQSSGNVTLTEDAGVFALTQSANRQPTVGIIIGGNLLAGHWPSLHIHVASQIPSARVISLQANGASAIVTGPKDVLPHLLYRSEFSCGQGQNNGGNFQWTPMTQSTLHAPDCALTDGTWTYAISAPGYAIASGKFGK